MLNSSLSKKTLMISNLKVKYIFILLLINLLSTQNIAFAQVDTQPQIDSLSTLFHNATELEEKKKLLKSLSNLYERKGNWEKYEEIVKQMLLLQEEKEDSFYLAETYNKLGISNSILGKNQEAVNYFQKALEINIAQKEHLIEANSYENMGAAYKDMGDYSNAVDCLLKSLEIRKESNHPRIFNNYMKLAVLQQLLDDIPNQDYYLGLAKQELQKRDSVSPSNFAIFYNELGNIYKTREMFDSCIVFYKNVIRYSEQIGWNLGIAEGLGNLADVYFETGVLDSSIIYHKQSLKLSEKILDCMGASEEYLYIAELYQELNKNDSVLFYASEALRKAEECNLLREQSLALKFIADYQSSQNKFEQAFIFLQRHYTVNDAISSADIKNNISELETKYQTKVKEQQIDLLTTENRLKNQRLRAGIFLIAVLIIVILLILYILNIRRNQAELKQNDLQQQVLRSQMNPHFIFNVLGSIQNFMLQNENREASKFLSQFASLTRGTLNNSVAETISLADEISMLKNYVELEKMRSGNKFDFNIIYSNDLEVDLIRIPPMLIQPFVENSIKHGFKNLEREGFLSLHISDKTDWVEFIIEDNGNGIHKNDEIAKEHQSMAMNIFEKRRKLIQQKHHKKFTFELLNLNDTNPKLSGVKITIDIPVLNND